jgi:hypothetical protein
MDFGSGVPHLACSGYACQDEIEMTQTTFRLSSCLGSDVVEMAGWLCPRTDGLATHKDRSRWMYWYSSALPQAADHFANIAFTVWRHGRRGFIVLGFGG